MYINLFLHVVTESPHFDKIFSQDLKENSQITDKMTTNSEIAPLTDQDSKNASSSSGAVVKSASPLRTLIARYNGKSGGELTILEIETVYKVKTHMFAMETLLHRPHMEFEFADGRGRAGTATFHKTTARVDITVNSESITILGNLGVAVSIFTFSSANLNSTGTPQKMKWTRKTQTRDLVCVDHHGTPVAKIVWGLSAATQEGRIEILTPLAAKGQQALDEIVITGMALIHLSLYMGMYGGAQGGGGVGGAGGVGG